MQQKQLYVPENGVAVFSPLGYQRLQSASNGAFYYISGVETDILINNKWEIDYVWENGDFYYTDGETVYKKKYNGTDVASLDLSSPLSVAVRQSIVPLPNNIENHPGSDIGCWIVDDGTKKLIQTDANLTSVKEITNLDNPVIVSASPDGGCYFFDDAKQYVYKVSSSVVVEAFISYADIGIANSLDVRSLDTDIESSLWFVAGTNVKKIQYSNGGLSVTVSVNIINALGLGHGYITDLSVEKSTVRDNVYAVGCYGTGSWIAKLNLSGGIVGNNNFLSADCPFLVQASQWGYSDAVYMISEDPSYMPAECESSSSESSDPCCYCGICCMVIGGCEDGLDEGLCAFTVCGACWEDREESQSHSTSSESSSSSLSSLSSDSSSSSYTFGSSTSSESSSSVDSSSSSSSVEVSSSSSSSNPPTPSFTASGFTKHTIVNGTFYEGGLDTFGNMNYYNDNGADLQNDCLFGICNWKIYPNGHTGLGLELTYLSDAGTAAGAYTEWSSSPGYTPPAGTGTLTGI